MKKLAHTVFVNVRYLLVKDIIPLLILSILIVVIYNFYSYKKNKSATSFKNVMLNNRRSSIILLLSSIYLVLPFKAAVINRFSNPRQNPFANIFGGWGIEELQYFYNFSLLWNIFMFVPFALIFYLISKYVFNKSTDIKRLNKICLISCTVYTAVIEFCQAVFRIGTLQISDIVYNILGAILGTVILKLITKSKAFSQ